VLTQIAKPHESIGAVGRHREVLFSEPDGWVARGKVAAVVRACPPSTPPPLRPLDELDALNHADLAEAERATVEPRR